MADQPLPPDARVESAAEARMWRLIWPGALGLQALYVACELRIADRLAHAPLTVEELAVATTTNQAALRLVLRVLVSFGIFRELADHRFGQNAGSELLLAGHPRSVRHRILLLGAPMVSQSVANLSQAVRSGQSAFEHAFGMPFYAHLAANRADQQTVQAAMPPSGSVAPAIMRCCDLARVSHVVDVGGGDGKMLRDMLEAFPHLRGTLYELPTTAVSSDVSPLMRSSDNRCRLVVGTCFDTIPVDGDLYVLSRVLHNWNDRAARTILRRCYEAIRPGVSLMVVERAYGRVRSRSRRLMELLFMLLTEGQERSCADICAMLADSGFSISATSEFASTLVIEAVRP